MTLMLGSSSWCLSFFFPFVFEPSFVFLLVLSGSRDDVFTLAGESIEENSWPLLLTQCSLPLSDTNEGNRHAEERENEGLSTWPLTKLHLGSNTQWSFATPLSFFHLNHFLLFLFKHTQLQYFWGCGSSVSPPLWFVLISRSTGI